MTYCLNADCPHPQNPDRHRFCQSCGWRLRLGDRYEAAYPLGTGQNSRTFIGRDRATLTGAQCLIKRFTSTGDTALEREASAERFRKDIDHLTVASRHPQLPDLLAAFERDEQQFLVQQFLLGPHLDQRLQEKMGPFDSEEVNAFLRDVLPILRYLHQNAIVHRDIKPTNFRLPPDQAHWWLVDLGAFKPLTATRMAQPGTVVGSADYVAPEQLRGEATYASDIYSLGVVCLHLLTGLQPFDLFDSLQGFWQWRSIAPEVQPSLATLIDGMVQPALRDRIPTVETAMSMLGMTSPTLSEPLKPSAPLRPRWQADWEAHSNTKVIEVVPVQSLSQLLILTADRQIEVRSLEAPDEQRQTLEWDSLIPSAIAVHPQEPLFVLGTRQGILERWRFTNDTWQKESTVTFSYPVTQLLSLSDSSDFLVADDRGHLYQQNWQWQEATPSRPLKGNHQSSVSSLALSHDGCLLASGDTHGVVKIWQVSTGECLRTLSRHQGAITALAWLADDQTLVTAGWDVTVRWRYPQTGGTLQSVRAEGFYLPVRSLLAHPTEPDVLIGTQDGHLQRWAFDQSQDSLDLLKKKAVAPQMATPIIALHVVPSPPNTLPKIFSMTEAGAMQMHTM